MKKEDVAGATEMHFMFSFSSSAALPSRPGTTKGLSREISSGKVRRSGRLDTADLHCTLPCFVNRFVKGAER